MHWPTNVVYNGLDERGAQESHTLAFPCISGSSELSLEGPAGWSWPGNRAIVSLTSSHTASWDACFWLGWGRAFSLSPLQVVGSQARILYSDQKGRVAIAVAINQAIASGKIKVSEIACGASRRLHRHLFTRGFPTRTSCSHSSLPSPPLQPSEKAASTNTLTL